MSANKLSIGQVNYTNNNGDNMILELNSGYMALAMGGLYTETPNFIKQVNGEVDNPHPLTVALQVLFGDKLPPDILDYFGKVSPKKKTLHKNPLTFSEVLEVIQASTKLSNEMKDWKIDNSIWKTLKGNPEGSAFTTQEISQIAYLTKEHYAIVAVPSGFYYYSTLVNLHDIVDFCNLENSLPANVWEYWWTSAAISIWVIYEGLGLGGLNKPALQLHSYISEFSRRGLVELDEDHPDAVLLAEIGSYELIYSKWVALLKSEGIKLELCENRVVFDTVLWLAHLRAISQKTSRGNELSKYQNEFTFGDLDIDHNLLLSSVAVVMRDSAKGRMNLETEQDNQEMAGCLQYLFNEQPEFVEAVTEQATDSPANCSLGILMLKDQLYYQQQFTRLRLAEKAND
jgi:hypothetical protein